MDIIPHTIRRFLYGLECQDLARIAKMDYRMAEIRKITNWTVATKEKMMVFRWIEEIIAAYSEHTT